MPILREKRVFIMGIEWLTLYSGSLLSIHIIKATEAMGLIADTDDFKTFRDEYITNAKDARVLQDFKAKCIDKHLSEFPQKKIIRPLIDSIERARRKYL